MDEIGTVDHVGIEERVAKYGTRSLKKQSKVFGLRMAVSMVDLTTLEGKDTPGKVASLCQKALTPHDEEDIPSIAAVCVYPAMVKHAKKHVTGTSVKVASVNKEGFTPLHSARSMTKLTSPAICSQKVPM